MIIAITGLKQAHIEAIIDPMIEGVFKRVRLDLIRKTATESSWAGYNRSVCNVSSIALSPVQFL
ncbi:hypothetical protein IOQ59_19450 [Pontibacterium sp. N1Y112]|uniref:Uncharacterized protein n=1 Tax=Pontibacterium sinense TaxID=2781979 RepID=A0A8J7FGR5_9GAMM|nr:hypothetical protein [Pontibacterium sinense]MBE9399444.1 hypothetical protein [Pontibacterium sinense]